MAAEPDPAAVAAVAPPRPRRAILRFALFVALLAAAAAAFRWTPLRELVDREAVVALLGTLREAWWAPAALLGLYVAIGPLGLPMSPLIFAGGAIFGVVWGSIYNVLGNFLGAVTGYLLARLLGRDLVVHLAGDKLARVEALLARHGFWTLVRLRFLPLPAAVTNFGAALAGVPFLEFALASALGLTPTILLWTYFAAALSGAAADARGPLLRNVGLALVGLLLLTLLPTLWTRWRAGRNAAR